MIKIKIFSKANSDASRMFAKGWDIRMYRDRENANGSSVTAEKGNVKFIITQKDDGEHIILKKFVNETCVDTKEYRRDNTEQCEGTLFINDHRDPTNVYAFFRNEELQNLMDCCGAERLVFLRFDADTIPKTAEPETEYITDGEVDEAGNINNATFIFTKENAELKTVQNYNMKVLEKYLL